MKPQQSVQLTKKGVQALNKNELDVRHFCGIMGLSVPPLRSPALVEGSTYQTEPAILRLLEEVYGKNLWVVL